MQSLNEKEWGEFDLSEVYNFDLANGDIQLKKASRGDTPLVSAGFSGNGIVGFIEMDTSSYLFSENKVTVDMFGQPFYQPAPFQSVSHGRVNILSNETISNETNMFIVPCIKNGTTSKYSYNQMCSQKRLQRQKLMLPVNNSSEPDYEYMTEYTRQKRDAMLNKYRKYAEACIAELGEVVEIPALDEKEWGEFVLDDVFTVHAGKRLETRNKVEGMRPFIGATDNGNGITGFVGNDNTSKDSNILGVNYNGAPCIAFYHPYECIFTDDVKRLHLKNHADDKYILLFFTSIFAMQRVKYSYGYKFKEKRMLRQKLMLPVTEAGEPDYEYMEQYAKNMMLRKYKQYLEFINRQNVTEVD